MDARHAAAYTEADFSYEATMNHSPDSLFHAFQALFPKADDIGSYIAGRLVPGRGDPIQLYDPATGEKSLSYRDGGVQLIGDATAAAQLAQKQWWAMTHAARGRVLYAI